MGAKGSTHTGKVFTLEELAKFDGTTLPSYIGILGQVYDVSESSNFQAGGGYGDLWAGNDATYALATLSLDKKDASRLDWELSQFNEQQLKALAAWKSYFDQKYPVVGVLKEYEGRCIDLPDSLIGQPGPVYGGPYVQTPDQAGAQQGWLLYGIGGLSDIALVGSMDE
eukprot:g2211.t1